MSSRNMKLDEIKARAQAAFETTEQRKRDALLAWQALDDAASQTRLKTEKLKALRMARDAEEAAAKAAAPPKAKSSRAKPTAKAAPKPKAAPKAKPAAKTA
ncbi:MULTISPECIES: hypothetical protein [unclassified Bosea (in: a-proteobacteria)]|jgi:hypothetical protein|uniref:hypothetical protein n=1 Tax=unclassified Bosea (in: a-proteobacteria) TaxID=2653178 RepID=UPI0009564417|nr:MULTISPECIES: hypothetical protein [unclassified Bosea (in: a-proteobacteria)]TAJ31318.1 MAG: hypothetical protein EPO59_08535 [Bosea sp. (in: a-proteobacteria)]SIQ32958.1 hypothetical protein SAMN05880592_102416 [Bosea sp. TND4EK4]